MNMEWGCFGGPTKKGKIMSTLTIIMAIAVIVKSIAHIVIEDGWEGIEGGQDE